MNLPALFTPVTPLRALLVLFTAAKVLSSLGLLLLGDYRATTHSLYRRVLSMTSKVTPTCMLLSYAALQYRQGQLHYATLFALLSVIIGLLAFYVVRLRRQGRFYGLADCMTRFMTPRQVKAVLLLCVAVMLFMVAHTR